jgi:hypothetical protein
VIVRAGQQSIVRPGQGPSEPVAVPTKLLLKVALPGEQTVRDQKLVVRGKVEAGAIVEIAGQSVRPDSSGNFAHSVSLPEGRSELSVKATAISGAIDSSRHKVTVDSKVSNLEVPSPSWEDPPEP